MKSTHKINKRSIVSMLTLCVGVLVLCLILILSVSGNAIAVATEVLDSTAQQKTLQDDIVTSIDTENGYLIIAENGGNPNESFLYRITDESGNELIVSVKGNGETIVSCPLGDYTVEEITDWAWRYKTDTYAQSVSLTVNSGHIITNPVRAEFTNNRNNKVWLGSENSKDHLFPRLSTTNMSYQN